MLSRNATVAPRFYTLNACDPCMRSRGTGRRLRLAAAAQPPGSPRSVRYDGVLLIGGCSRSRAKGLHVPGKTARIAHTALNRGGPRVSQRWHGTSHDPEHTTLFVNPAGRLWQTMRDPSNAREHGWSQNAPARIRRVGRRSGVAERTDRPSRAGLNRTSTRANAVRAQARHRARQEMVSDMRVAASLVLCGPQWYGPA